MKIQAWTVFVAAGAACSLAGAQSEPLTTPFPDLLELSSLDGEIGVRFRRVSGGTGGRAVQEAGDLNGDGLTDLVFGGASDDRYARNGGAAYFVFGREVWTDEVVVDTPDGTNGFAIHGAGQDFRLGHHVSALGDINGDGFDDVGIEAPGVNDYDGATFVLFGQAGGWPATFTTDDIGTTVPGMMVTTGGESSIGTGMSRLGDVNGDGRSDCIFGAPYAEGTGVAYVVFGREPSDPFPTVLNVSELDGSDGFALTGGGDRSGYTAADAGDINGDGSADIFVAAPGFGQYEGFAYIVYGRDDGSFPPSVSLGSLIGSEVVRLDAPSGLYAGVDLAGTGDINGDGVDDVVMAADSEYYAGVAARAYVVFGKPASAGGLPAIVNLASLDGSDGFQFGEPDPTSPEFGGVTAVECIDLNGDGLAEFLASNDRAWVGSTRDVGEVYVLYGRDAAAEPFPARVLFEDVVDEGGVVIRGTGLAGLAGTGVSSAGDANGDGREDLMVGGSGISSFGGGYMVFGRDVGCRADLDGDGELTLFDFLEFQNLFDTGDPIADFDGDGALTLFDFLAFQNEFDAGCE